MLLTVIPDPQTLGKAQQRGNGDLGGGTHGEITEIVRGGWVREALEGRTRQKTVGRLWRCPRSWVGGGVSEDVGAQ